MCADVDGEYVWGHYPKYDILTTCQDESRKKGEKKLTIHVREYKSKPLMAGRDIRTRQLVTMPGHTYQIQFLVSY